jgi:hypothetical protein
MKQGIQYLLDAKNGARRTSRSPNVVSPSGAIAARLPPNAQVPTHKIDFFRDRMSQSVAKLHVY